MYIIKGWRKGAPTKETLAQNSFSSMSVCEDMSELLLYKHQMLCKKTEEVVV